mgnify:CR=1 FL=1
MRVPRSWLAEFIDIPAAATLDDIADAYVRIGIEPETTEVVGADLVGPIVVGKVLEFVEEPQSNGKTIRWCQVDVGGTVHGIVCGARNFFEGDKVVVSLPGAVLPGGFAIAARKTYGHTSDGMICSAKELGMGDDHSGIIRLVELGLDPELGSDAIELLQLRDEVIELNVLPDSGYVMSIRGAARELSHATGWTFHDRALSVSEPQPAGGDVTGVSIRDAAGCDHIVLRTLVGFDPHAQSPIWMKRRLQMAGTRAISLAVDITNYVMYEFGQPLHAFDRTKLRGDIVVRFAAAGETLETLDHVKRTLRVTDVLIADARGPIALAGTMGGLDTEIDEDSTEIVIEAAHFNARLIGRQSRGHQLISEASKRFERDVDADVQSAASARAINLLMEFGGGSYTGQASADVRPSRASIAFPLDAATKLVGYEIGADAVKGALSAIGCTLADTDPLQVTPPSWRSDLIGVAELVEEVARFTGYDNIPSVLPVARDGNGLTAKQRMRRKISKSLAYGGMVEVLNYPFIGPADHDAQRIPADDWRRKSVSLLNPLSAEQAEMRTSLLGPLLTAAQRNVGRGQRDLAIYEMGLVTLPSASGESAGQPGIERRPSDAELAQIDAAIPQQVESVAGVLVGQRLVAGALAEGRAVSWADAIAIARGIGATTGVELTVRAEEKMPWHPGRCAALLIDGEVLGYAGELHPKVADAYGLPRGSAAFEIWLEPLYRAGGGAVVAAPVKTFPVALQDLAFITPNAVTVAELQAALEAVLGDVCESVRCFDVYTGEPVPAGHRSLAFALRLRAGDRTLSEVELAEYRERAVAAGVALGGILR